MPGPSTQPFASRLTSPAVAGSIAPEDKLFAAVVAYNMRQAGRTYPLYETGSMFDAVKAFNSRRTTR